MDAGSRCPQSGGAGAETDGSRTEDSGQRDDEEEEEEAGDRVWLEACMSFIRTRYRSRVGLWAGFTFSSSM